MDQRPPQAFALARTLDRKEVSVMAETRVASLDHTIQQTNSWLKRLEEVYQLDDRHQAYVALRAVLHTLRDRLPAGLAVHLGAQLPLLVRGIYYEGWRMPEAPTPIRHRDEFADALVTQLPPSFPVDPLTAARAVFELLWTELDSGEINKVVHALPAPLRSLWP
jgi:uncharacterized protein (DUF2267 family)